MKFPEFDFQLELPQKYSLNMPCLKHESPIATNVSTDWQQEQIIPQRFSYQPKRNTSEGEYYLVFIHCRCLWARTIHNSEKYNPIHAYLIEIRYFSIDFITPFTKHDHTELWHELIARLRIRSYRYDATYSDDGSRKFLRNNISLVPIFQTTQRHIPEHCKLY
jgi:hypothetical protein